MNLPVPPALVFCAECGSPFYPHGVHRIFCEPSCKTRRHARRMKAAYQLIDLAIEWRLNRTKGALAELTFALDNGIVDEERKIRSARALRVAEAKKAIKARGAH